MSRAAFAAFIVAVLAFVGVGVYLFVEEQQTQNTVNEIVKVVHTATCGGGHSQANLAACHRLCPNLESISNLRCKPKGVVVGGNPVSHGLVGPRQGGHHHRHTPERPSAPVSRPPLIPLVPDLKTTLCNTTASLSVCPNLGL